jgi:molybdenum cofactor cytidylyltransferase
VKAAGIILAAGESRRMGRPKALLEFRGATFVDTLVETLSPFCAPVVVVTGAHDREIRAGMRLRARVVFNPAYACGQLTSLQAGLRELPPEIDRVLFTLVDHPVVRESTVACLLEPEAPFVIPRHNGRRGHPAVFAAALIPEILSLAPGEQVRTVRDRYAEQIMHLDVDDPGVVNDVDDPDAYRRLVEAAAQ